ncbi:RNA-binding protein Prp24 [Schizosaccharomyces cryophilus OY26]|uniref:U4/U6 snRNA-associated-splicing factor PRP24 n=1 Tax=Schizosaccharomyces cryophilus (strain OY26 / ATCC MYA-4695 / CBS 11777 / NBRC 106824 / NRRL Y48691) TaxID=653667 RepID=S9XIM3_SCHCR|nr:RNA-binding protein Prp24 [Schizosaccharomyces cryophilus OY26]EPY53496.1 RNA-binding protein Prp24 [Schizosaccharomyces cryophilus OY26]
MNSSGNLEHGSTNMEMDTTVSSESKPSLVSELLEFTLQHPYNYEGHVKLIEELKQHGLKDDLHSARKRFQSLFPLSEDIWIEYLEDEKAVCNTLQDYERIIGLFESAVKDYLSIRLWRLYLDFLLTLVDPSTFSSQNAELQDVVSLQDVHALFKRAYESCKYHFSQSQRIWEQYLEFLEETGENLFENDQTISLQDRMYDFYVERLEIPHSQIEETFSSLSSFVTKNWSQDEYEVIMSNTNKIYEMNLSKFKKIYDNELQLSASNHSLECYMDLLNIESRRSTSIPSYIATLYERAICFYPLVGDLWLEYLAWVSKPDFPPQAFAIAERSVRNCPFVGRLWAIKLLYMIVVGLSNNAIQQEKETCLQMGLLSGFDEYCAFFSEYLKLCIYISSNELDPVLYIKNEIQVIENFMHHHFPGLRDDSLRIESAKINLFISLNDYESAERCWNGLQKDFQKSTQFWIIRYTATSRYNIELAIDSLRKGLYKDVDNPMLLFQFYESVVTLNHDCFTSISQFFDVTQAKKLFVKRSLTSQAQNQEIIPSMKEVQEKPTTSPDHAKKRKPTNGEDIIKKTRLPEKHRNREEFTILVSNLPNDISEKELQQFFKGCGNILQIFIYDDQEGKKIAQIEFSETSEVLAAKTKDLKQIKGHEVSIQIHVDTTLYVTNFPPTFDESKITDLFTKYGRVVQVRFPSLKFDTNRRFCYVQMSTPEEAHHALQLHSTTLGNQYELKVFISDPNKSGARSGAVYEKRELYLTNIDFSIDENQVRNFFQDYGTVESVRLPSRDSKSHMGFGYVVMSTSTEADNALNAAGKVLGKRVLNVVISQPKKAINKEKLNKDKRPTFTKLLNKSTDDSKSRPTTLNQVHSKSLGIINVDQTINEARLRSIFEPYGEIFRVVLHPEHEGAIVEYADIHNAGKAALAVEGMNLSGRELHVTTVNEMMHNNPDHNETLIPTPRPRKASARLGIQKFQNSRNQAETENNAKHDNEDAMQIDPPKTNDDFRRFLFKGT